MKFIVLEGLDGSGKSTQVKLLKQYFENNNINYKYLHFPRTEEGLFGDLVARFLRGDFGKNDQVNPYLVALLYAGDREHAAKQIQQWINEDTYVLVDRYVLSNIAFQCAKIENHLDKKKLTDWIFHLEYEYFNIPQPDIELFLDVPFTFTKQSLDNNRIGDDRSYLQGKVDIHEENLNFQEIVRQEYLRLLSEKENYFKIDCYDNQNLIMNPEIIAEKIINTLQQYSII